MKDYDESRYRRKEFLLIQVICAVDSDLTEAVFIKSIIRHITKLA